MLAGYMDAYDQARRTLLRDRKYAPLARFMQHQIAQKTVTDHIEEGKPLPGDLSDRADQIRNMLADTDFDQQMFDQNADYVQSFSEVSHKFDLNAFDIAGSEEKFDRAFNGTLVKFRPHFLVWRTTKVNSQKVGSGMFRYSKSGPVVEAVAQFQAAFMFGYFSTFPCIEESKPEAELCFVLCANNGSTHHTPRAL